MRSDMDRGRLLLLVVSLALFSLNRATAQQSVTITDQSDGGAVTLSVPSGFTLTCSPPCSGGGGAPAISVSPNPVVHGQTVTVNIQNDLGVATDWVAIGPAGTVNPCNGGTCILWAYFNGTHTAPSVGSKTGTFTFTAPPPGSYDVHLSFNNTSVDEAPVVPLTVQ